MTIPIAYNLRNLVVRKTTSIMTALGIALTVAVLLTILSLISGLRHMLSASGDPLQVIVLRKGSESEVTSNFNRAQFQDLKFKPGIARARNGEPLASLEIVTAITLTRTGSSDEINVTVRGLLPVGIEVRPELHLASGRWFEQGRRELVVGKALGSRFADAHVGRKIVFGHGDWEVVGVMDAGNGAQNSEIWGDLNQVSTDLGRGAVLSSAIVRAADPAGALALVNDVNNDQKLNVSGMTAKHYFDLQTRSAGPIVITGILVSLIMAIGSSFAAMNTMYAAVARRSREIGMLRVVGFSPGSILLSFFIETALLSALGGVLGGLLVLPLNGLVTGIGNLNFTETAFGFRVTLPLLLTGVVFAMALGSLGGFLPARIASKKEILAALREA